MTNRQLQVVRLLCEGLDTKEIGQELGMSKRSVKGHIHNLCQSLHVRNRDQIIIYCFEHGVVDGKERRPLPKLTRRCHDVASQMLKGKTYEEIAAERHCKVSSVKNRVREIYVECGVWSRVELISRYMA